ncbi:alpha/beta fold hydrolase [Aliikangiella maris]|uniref:Alpha/beta fold hydrolase n=2 Tax=Aliikangiella maris TaxID=3162458 RepID=A0ABV3MKG6_9GAMM
MSKQQSEPRLAYEVETVYAEDNVPLPLKYFTATKNRSQQSPTLILFPAMGVKNSFYTTFIAHLNNQGLNVVCASIRGNGGTGIDVTQGDDFGIFDIIQYDFPCIINAAKIRFPASRYLLAGHSLGGILSALYASSQLKDDHVSGLICIASCSNYYRGWSFPHRYLIASQLILAKAVVRLKGYFPGPWFKFAGNEAKQLFLDWSATGLTGHYKNIKSPFDFENLLAELKIPVLNFSFEGDKLAPQRATENLFSKLVKAPVTSIHLSPADLSLERVSHFSWAKKPDAIVSRINDWLFSA